MKGGIFALSETFMKIISTAFLAIVLLGIFLALNDYTLIYTQNRMERETLVVGNIVLSSCIAEERNEYPVKGLLSEEKIQQYENVKNENIDCLDYSKGIYVMISRNEEILYSFGNGEVCEDITNDGECIEKPLTYYTDLPASLKRTNDIVPVNVRIFVGSEYDISEDDQDEEPEPTSLCPNGACEDGENYNNCPKDCPSPLSCSSETPNSIKHTNTLGSCQYTNQNNPNVPLQWHRCQYRTPSGERTVCYQGTCEEVGASVDFTLPRGIYARSDTITISYTIVNSGNLPWCFYVEAGSTCQCLERDSYLRSEFVSIPAKGTYTGSFSYYIECDVTVMDAHDQLTSPNDWWNWNSYAGVYTDNNNYGWPVLNSPENYNMGIVECLNDQDCINCLGYGHTCNRARYLCT
ncbi:MAG: hypothetical protein JW700_02210 [Candidatus Aenigmarchaeota archaeon]|nr:hypothetical protein [Candidatus Aenigmarchaeota archaeon]